MAAVKASDCAGSAESVITLPPFWKLSVPAGPVLTVSIVGVAELPRTFNSPPLMFTVWLGTPPPRRLLKLVPLLSSVKVPPTGNV